MTLISKQFATKLTVEPGERSVIARISTISVDRDGDVLLPSGADFTDYRKNPVVLFVHDSSRLPVGTAPAIQKNPNDITAKVKFAERPASLPDVQEWVPDTVHELFKQGVLRAFSVGFTITRAREADKRDIRKFGDDVRRVITDWKLLEFSVVPVPANQDALVMAVSKGYIPTSSWVVNALHEPELEPVFTKRDVLLARDGGRLIATKPERLILRPKIYTSRG